MIQQHVKKLSTLLHNSNWRHDFIYYIFIYWLPLERSICRRSFALTSILTSARNILSETNLVSFPVSRGKICPLLNAGVICQRRKQIPVVAYCTIYRLLGGKGRGGGGGGRGGGGGGGVKRALQSFEDRFLKWVI